VPVKSRATDPFCVLLMVREAVAVWFEKVRENVKGVSDVLGLRQCIVVT
jgi:hypothetical protein